MSNESESSWLRLFLTLCREAWINESVNFEVYLTPDSRLQQVPHLYFLVPGTVVLHSSPT